MFLHLKPFSVNMAWRRRTSRSQGYLNFLKDVQSELYGIKSKLKPHHILKIEIIFGFSAKSSDSDNPLKPLLDAITPFYEIDDKQFYDTRIIKALVKRGEEFIWFNITVLYKPQIERLLAWILKKLGNSLTSSQTSSIKTKMSGLTTSPRTAKKRTTSKSKVGKS